MKRLLALGILMLLSSPLYALTYQTYTDRVAWTNAVGGGIQSENFNAEVAGNFSSRAFSLFSVTNLDTNNNEVGVLPGGAANNVDGSKFLLLLSGTQDCSNDDGMLMQLNNPATALGLDYNNTDPTGDNAEMVIYVDGQEFVFAAAQTSGFFGIVALDGGFQNVEFQDDQEDGGGCVLSSLGLDNISMVDAGDTARFRVTKTFSNGLTAPISATLTCDTGQPLTQTKTIFGGDPEGVNFILINIPQGGADCAVTETGGPSGYTRSYTPNPCTYENVEFGQFSCVIANAANNATYTVVKDWVLDGTGGNVIDAVADVTITCNRAIVGVNEGPPGTWRKSADLGDNQSLVASVDVSTGNAICGATEVILQSGVESSASGCSPSPMTPGSSRTCTFTNTVFFEGVPTLSQYGMAILALLMLGVGFVGFRRFA